ncbi:MAG: 3-dehydroquinate synthase [Magnetococcales bacterium]|nr:3-dehydroquinate synthase [Magnetococcales bacterium]
MHPSFTLPLDLGPRSYDIVIGHGLLGKTGSLVKPLAPGRQVAVVTSTVIAPLYLEPVATALGEAGFTVLPIILPDGEEYKEWPTLQMVFDALIENRFERSTLLVALGGGVVGDMTGFAAATFMRGVPFVQIPTTVLAQVDASVGGKTGINHPLGKNLIGAFYQPRLVLIDTATLKSLPKREILAGLAEVIKYGMLRDADLFAQIEKVLDGLIDVDPDVVTPIIRSCCAIKADIVAADERESGRRALLNLGHTFGHAIETLTRYQTFLHGEAVAIGMVLAADLSVRCGLTSDATTTRVRTLLQRAGLPTRAPRFPVEQYLEAMARDKKVQDGRIRFVLVEKVGQAVVRDAVDPALVAATLSANMAEKKQ